MGKVPDPGMAFMDKIINDIPNVSVITQIEALGFNSSRTTEKLLSDFFTDAVVLGLADEVVAQTIELRKSYKIKLPDAIIAATALVHSMNLVTRNIVDFHKIVGFDCIDPHSI